MKKRLYRVLALVMVAVMTFSLAGCKKTPDDEGMSPEERGVSTDNNVNVNEEIVINRAQVTFPTESPERLQVETDAATAINDYLVARLYLDKFLQYDIANGNPDEYAALLQDTINAFALVEKVSLSLKSSAADLESLESDDSYSSTDGSCEYKDIAYGRSEGSTSFLDEVLFSINPFEVVACAEEENDALKWAKDITERFDKAPAGKGIRTLAEQMGTDAKHAYAQLKQAQDILAGNAYNDFAKTADAAYKTAKVLKTAGTAAQLTLSIVTANPATMTEAVMTGGGILVNGLNTVLEVGQTGSVLFVGDDNKVSQTLENVENALAPIGSAIGLYSLTSNVMKGAEFLKDTPAVADSIMYIGSSLNDYLSDGKIMGGTWTQDAGGKISCTILETMTIKSAWAKPDASASDANASDAGASDANASDAGASDAGAGSSDGASGVSGDVMSEAVAAGALGAATQILDTLGYTAEEIKVATAGAGDRATSDSGVASTAGAGGEAAGEGTFDVVNAPLPIDKIDEILGSLTDYVALGASEVDSVFADVDVASAIIPDDVSADAFDGATLGDDGPNSDAGADSDDADADDADVDDANSDAGADSNGGDADEAQSEFPSISEVCGTYTLSVHMTMGDQEADGSLTYKFSNPGGKTLAMADNTGYTLKADYNESTGKVTYTDSDGTPIYVSFSRTDNGKIKIKININADYGSMAGSGVR